MFYRRITKGLNHRGFLVDADTDPLDHVKDESLDWYVSVFKYTEEQKNIFDETGTVAGITDVVTDRIWWDFDSEVEPSLAQHDTFELCKRLNDDGIDARDMMITFSGNKGFGVEVKINHNLNPKQIKKIASEYADELASFDKKMYNASRVLRIIATKHQKTGYYKIPLTFSQLKNCSTDEIIEMSKNVPEGSDEFRWDTVDLDVNDIVKEEKESIKETKERISSDRHLDFSAKPRFLTNCRWSLQNGYFKDGERSTALLCLASTYKNLGFDIEHVYRLLKGVAELQVKVNPESGDRFPDEEIYNNIVMQVFGPHWNNGQYSCREDGNWLYDYCQALEHKCNHKVEEDLRPKGLIDIRDSFKDYVKHIEENTVKLGIPGLDEAIFVSTGANVGFIAAPGAGKTSLGLQILNHTSKAGVKSVFASLDMHRNRMFEKVMYKITGLSRDEIYHKFKTDQEGPWMNKLKEEFGNVFFFNKSSPSVEDIRNYILACQDQTGEKIRFLMLDYFERVSSDIGDDTAASKRVAGELQDLVNDLDIALITLVQPNKNALSGGPDQPIYDYTKIKGSSYVYQAFRIIVSLWRPFYNPKTFDNDKFMQMAVLKNDLGELAEFKYGWNGKKGEITTLDQCQEEEFEELMRAKQMAKEAENPSGMNF